MEIKKEKDTSTRLNKDDAVGKVTGFFLFRNFIDGYNADKNKSEDERKNIRKYGKLSITLSIIALLISACCLFFNLSNVNFFGFSYVLMLVIYVFSGIIISIFLSIYGFVFGVMQIRLNRKSIGVFGLVLSILSMLSSVFLIIILVI
ncbi:MAG: hypothetical protein EOM55_00800 [Clostridia bacterium]|nr:hypothetical protein [Clostridia bacterium]